MSDRCENCDEKFEDGQKIIYHTELDQYFCSHDCATQYDMQYRREEIYEPEEQEDEDHSTLGEEEEE
jgi:hypothetical protein